MSKLKSILSSPSRLITTGLVGLCLLHTGLYGHNEGAAQAQEITPEQMAQFQEQMALQQKRYQDAQQKLDNLTPEQEADLLKQLAVLLSTQVASIGLNEKEQADFVKNFEGALANSSKVELDQDSEILFSLYLQKRMADQQAVQFKKQLDAIEGLVTTESGLKYKVERAGTGAQVKDNSVVMLNYKGSLIDGTVFDSTEGRGPAEFDLGQIQLIPGFKEGLLTAKQGGKTTLYIPSDLAYGANPPQRSPIPPNAPLIFEIEVLEIK